MSPLLDAGLRSWAFEPWLMVALLVSASVYLRGWRILRRRDNARWSGGQLVAFLGGLATIYVALASPIDVFAGLLFQVHMLQHLLLMMVAPPLIWLGAPMFPMLRGLPESIRTYWVAPLFHSRTLRTGLARLSHPAAALPIFVATTWLWHAPLAYELALRAPAWHFVQHTCFLFAGLLFWYPVVQPYPSHPGWSPWLLVPYLLLADVQNTALSALLTFSDRLWYPHYSAVPRLGRFSALDDQAAAGVLMWLPGSIVFLVPLFVIGFRLLYGQRGEMAGRRARVVTTSVSSPRRTPARGSIAGRIALPVIDSAPLRVSQHPMLRFDLLRVWIVGRFLKWRHARLTLQLPMAVLAGVLILDGLRGPQIAPMNLAGVLPWIHWRGLLILSLLVAGNLFCMACPFLLPRTLARRWLPSSRNWPRYLQSKWLAVGLLVLFLWAYEAFSLWDSPWLTAWIAVAYFAAAFVVDGFFRGAAFCKYVCPIGQFNFVQSLVSPLEVKVRDLATCTSCQSKDCIGGRGTLPGCELHLLQPRKAGNMDCTFCLDCIHACPHDNVGILTRLPGSELWQSADRPGLAMFGKRHDLAVLIFVLVFGAFANAAGMVGPVLEWRDRFSAQVLASPLLVTSLSYVVALLLLPLLAVGGAALVSRRWSGLGASSFDVATRYSYALVPLGFSMWLAHYSFHFVTSADTIIPVTQRFVADLGCSALGQPHWVAACCRRAADWLPRLEVLSLDFGLLLSLYAGYRIAHAQSSRLPQALRALAPWAVLMTLLFAAGIWLVFQPMQMRGTLRG